MVLLVYHYFKVDWLYKPARLIVGSFVWLSAYGNTAYFLKSGNITVARLLAVMLRLHLAPLVLCALMDVPLMLYYVVPQTAMTLVMSCATVWLARQLSALVRRLARCSDTVAAWWGPWLAVAVLASVSLLVWDCGGWSLLWGCLPDAKVPLPQWSLSPGGRLHTNGHQLDLGTLLRMLQSVPFTAGTCVMEVHHVHRRECTSHATTSLVMAGCRWCSRPPFDDI